MPFWGSVHLCLAVYVSMDVVDIILLVLILRYTGSVWFCTVGEVYCRFWLRLYLNLNPIPCLLGHEGGAMDGLRMLVGEVDPFYVIFSKVKNIIEQNKLCDKSF